VTNFWEHFSGDKEIAQAKNIAAAAKAAGVKHVVWSTLEDTRKLLEANLFHHDLITPEELALRHSRSIGQNFTAFVARAEAAEAAPPKEPKTPLWQRLVELQMPLLLIFGRNDRANAAKRATMLKEAYPQLAIHIADDCKHLVPWDAADDFVRLAIPFLKT